MKEWNSGRAGSLTFGGVMDFNASVPEVVAADRIYGQ